MKINQNQERVRRASSLLRTDSLIQEAGVDYSPKYFIVFSSLGALTSALFAYFLSAFNANPGFETLWPFLAALMLFGLSIVFQALFIRGLQLFFWSLLISALVLLLILSELHFAWGIFALLMMLATLLFGQLRAQRHLHERVKVRIVSFFREMLTMVMRALALLLAISYVGMYLNFGLSEKAFDFILRLQIAAFEPFIEDFRPEMSADDFFTELAKNEINRRFGESEQFRVLSQSGELEAAYMNAGRELRNQFVEVIKVPVAGEDTVGTYLYKVALEKLPNAEKTSRPGLILFAVIAFLTLYAFFIFFLTIIRIFILSPLSWLIYQLLKSLGLIRIQTQMEKKEVLVLK
ncbi:MAG: hypothetical protein Q8P45_00910 [Candidatus Harrisonbacteria bacterium]|nr:hypothetical protein [Candidatus Harrisonbacteria bacterium]